MVTTLQWQLLWPLFYWQMLCIELCGRCYCYPCVVMCSKYHLPHIWDEVLFNTSELKIKNNPPYVAIPPAILAITSTTCWIYVAITPATVAFPSATQIYNIRWHNIATVAFHLLHIQQHNDGSNICQ